MNCICFGGKNQKKIENKCCCFFSPFDCFKFTATAKVVNVPTGPWRRRGSAVKCASRMAGSWVTANQSNSQTVSHKTDRQASGLTDGRENCTGQDNCRVPTELWRSGGSQVSQAAFSDDGFLLYWDVKEKKVLDVFCSLILSRLSGVKRMGRMGKRSAT